MNEIIDPETVGLPGTAAHKLIEGYPLNEEGRAALEASMLELHSHKMPSPAVQALVDAHIQEALEKVPGGAQIAPEPKIHFQSYVAGDASGRLPGVVCTCGDKKYSLDFKKLGRWSEKHWLKTGHNTTNKK